MGAGVRMAPGWAQRFGTARNSGTPPTPLPLRGGHPAPHPPHLGGPEAEGSGAGPGGGRLHHYEAALFAQRQIAPRRHVTHPEGLPPAEVAAAPTAGRGGHKGGDMGRDMGGGGGYGVRYRGTWGGTP